MWKIWSQQTLLLSLDMEMRNWWRQGQLHFSETLYEYCLLSNLLHQVIKVARKEKGKGQISHRLTESSAALKVWELMENFLFFQTWMLHLRDTHRSGLLISALTGHLGAGAKLLHSRGRLVLQAVKPREAHGSQRI